MQGNIQEAKKDVTGQMLQLSEHYVVGIGASAGGLEAINELFDNIPLGSKFSFVIIQHLSPDYKILMDELLAKHTHMKIAVAEEGMLILPNRVYLIPSKKSLTIKNNKLHLVDKQIKSTSNYVINTFFTSLAEEKKHNAIGIILSGTGTDGTAGINAIKEHGGMVVVQDPATAKFDGMPNSAIETGNYDFILSPKHMGEKIIAYPQDRKNEASNWKPSFGDDGKTFWEILNLVKESTTNDFSAYKEETLVRLILKRMGLLSIEYPREYPHYLKNNPDEAILLGEDFLIGVTRFFRNPAAFDCIQDEVIPALILGKPENESIKIWVPACSTGEEVYSLAILFSEYLEKRKGNYNIKLFATDVNAGSVETAAKGAYPFSIAEDITQERLGKFFTKEGNHYCISSHIRKMVIFAHHNLLKDPPFSKVDLISCRNMLIYMKSELQKKILSTFLFSLNLGGYLFLGSSESVSSIQSSLKSVSQKWNIFKTTKVNKNFIFNDTHISQAQEKNYADKALNVKPSVNSRKGLMSDIFSEAMLEEVGYAALFVDENYNFIQALGDYKRFLVLPEKQLQLNLLKIVPEKLSIAISVALRKAQKLNQKVVSRKILVGYEAVTRTIDLIIKPYLEANQYNEKFYFLLLKEEKEEVNRKNESDFLDSQNSIMQLSEMESELNATRQSLRTTVEELETTNEELISSNEELQSTNEDLQSLNEELHTVNAEHQLKIRELSELNDDLNNYFRSTEIGQLFIDSNMLIRKYTPAVAQQINIIESDIGRPISHFSFNTRYTGLVEDIKYVIKTKETIEQEIEVMNNHHYQLRIFPYIRHDRTTDGVVITFVDITPAKNLNNLLAGVLNSSLSGILAFKSIKSRKGKVIDFEWMLTNPAAEKIIGKSNDELIGAYMLEVLPSLRDVGLFDKFVAVAENGKVYHDEIYYDGDGIEGWFEVVAVKVDVGIAITLANINEKKEAEKEIRAAYEEVKTAKERLMRFNNELENIVEDRTRELSVSEERFRLVSLATNDAVWDWNLVTNEFWWNAAFTEIFGHENKNVSTGVESWFERIHPQDHDRIVQAVHDVINQGNKKWNDEYQFLKSDGSYAFVYNRAYLLTDENEVPYRMLGSLVDLTDLKKIQEELRTTNDNLTKINMDLDNFVYTASHDLKSPIANLEGLTELLKESLKDKTNEQEWNIIELIDRSVIKLNKTVKALAEITKVQKDLDTSTEILSFQVILDDVKSDLQTIIMDANAHIEVDFEVSQMRYTKINLRSIFYNLISNAIKYRSPDRKVQIKIKAERIDQFVQLTFTDNGLGMSQPQLGKLFSMFKRFHRDIEGTGIGLYMVKRIVENRGGRIGVESEVDQGTTFKIFLIG